MPLIETVWPSIVARGRTASVAWRTSSLTSSGPIAWVESWAETGTPPAVLGAEVIVGASVGAKEPAAAIGAGGSAD